MPDGEPQREPQPGEVAAPKRKGPFAVDPVDPLVYQATGDSPELRPAASYVAVGPQLRAKTPKPSLPPQNLSYQKWTPGGVVGGVGAVEGRKPRRRSVAGALILFLMFLVPLLLVGATLWVASNI